jgi:hypothetical protein
MQERGQLAVLLSVCNLLSIISQIVIPKFLVAVSHLPISSTAAKAIAFIEHEAL